jgi:choline dehydrogenase-like flavoprotein
VSVLVIEAGSPNLNDPAICERDFLFLFHYIEPAMPHNLVTTGRYGSQIGNPKYDWGFTTVGGSFLSLLALMPHRCLKQTRMGRSHTGQGMSRLCNICYHDFSLWRRGKGLGGSSGINFFQYHLPSRADIDGAQLFQVGASEKKS